MVRIIDGFRNDGGWLPKEAEKACEYQNATYANLDENSSDKLETNFMGMPREGLGASNGAKGHFGPPKFDAAAFRFQGGRLGLKIRSFTCRR